VAGPVPWLDHVAGPVPWLDHVAGPVPWLDHVAGPVPWLDHVAMPAGATPSTQQRRAEVRQAKQRQRPDAEAGGERDRYELERLVELREREQDILGEPGSSAGWAAGADRLNLAAEAPERVQAEITALSTRVSGPGPGAGPRRAGIADQDPAAQGQAATPQLPQIGQLTQLPPLALTPRTPRPPGDRLDGRSASGPQERALAGASSRPSSADGGHRPPLAMAPTSAERFNVPEDPRADPGRPRSGLDHVGPACLPWRRVDGTGSTVRPARAAASFGADHLRAP
jgi:hypothetical protein